MFTVAIFNRFILWYPVDLQVEQDDQKQPVLRGNTGKIIPRSIFLQRSRSNIFFFLFPPFFSFVFHDIYFIYPLIPCSHAVCYLVEPTLPPFQWNYRDNLVSTADRVNRDIKRRKKDFPLDPIVSYDKNNCLISILLLFLQHFAI